MKKAIFVTLAVVLMAASTGCNRGWPNCFCRDRDMEDCAVADNCEPYPCGCEHGSHYGAGSPHLDGFVPPVPTPTPESLPGPAPNVGPARN